MHIFNKGYKRIITGLFIITLGFLIPAIASAQSAATGDLQGTIVDATSAPIPGVRVSATNEGTGLVRTVTTNEMGRYRIPELPAGEYKVRLVKQEFTTTEHRRALIYAMKPSQISIAPVRGSAPGGRIGSSSSGLVLQLQPA